MSDDRKQIVVVGGGISGLSLAHALIHAAANQGAPVDVRLFEADARFGGKIRSERRPDGYVLEWGPNGFLDSKPATLDLVERVGLSDRLLASSDATRKRFVFSRGKLRQLPESPGAFLKSRLLSWPAKLRLAWEPFVKPLEGDEDETVGEFARRRLGKQALARLLDPMISGVFAGDPDTLSLAAAFPRIAEMEARYGSLIKAMKAIGKERKAAAAAAGTDAEKVGPAPRGKLTAFETGLDELTDALATSLGDRVEKGRRVTAIEPATETPGPAYHVHFAGRAPVSADAVVLATPAYASAAILRLILPEVATELDAIPYAPMVVMGLGWERASFPHSLDGFGFLVPHEEARPLLGALWTSSIWPGKRAPEDRVLLRCMTGGALGRDLVQLGDDELVALAREDLALMMGVPVDVEPSYVEVVRHEHAIPNYPRGHRTHLEQIEKMLVEALPGVLLAGNAYRGISLNDCITNAPEIARRALDVAFGRGDGDGFLTFDQPA